MPTAPSVEFVPGHGGVPIAVHRLGAGRPVLLLHGLASNATINWMRYGTAARIVEAGFEAVMLDLRAHGSSGAPTDAAAYPPDVLRLDVEAVIAALGLGNYDLVGYSLGSRLAAMLVVAGARPGKLILGGMGLEGLTDWLSRRAFFLAALERWDVARPGDRDYLAIAFMKTVGIDRDALRPLLMSMSDFPIEMLARIVVPTLVLSGADDTDNGSAQALSQALPHAELAIVPGNHMSCITKAEFGTAIAEHLAA